jgi:cobalt-zinc-cadmium efflux system protein
MSPGVGDGYEHEHGEHGHGEHEHEHEHGGHEHGGHDHDHDEHREGAHGHGHGHGHGHAHHDHLRAASPGRLLVALALTVAFMVLDLFAGFYSHSLALLSDAGHMLADAGSLALAVFAQYVAARPRTAARTFGHRRAETMAALVNGVVLALSALWVVKEAIERWAHPHEVKGGWMLGVAALTLAGNLAAARVLAGGGARDANTRAALAHVLSDAAGSFAAILGAVCVIAFRWHRADPAISIVLAGLIFHAAWKLTRETVDILMEGAPEGLDLAELERTILATPGVASLHDLHAWTMSDGFDIVTVHVVLDGARHGTDVASEVAARIERAHKIAHVTVQPEAPTAASLVPPEALVRRHD